MIVPSPRRSRSTSASSKPSVVRTIASSRASPSGVVASPTQVAVRRGRAPRPTRPRSWWSWAMPKRSASRITITVALGTSTPTSITVVATSTSSSPARNSAIACSFSADGIRPCSSPSRRPGELAGRAAARRSPRPSATSSFSDSSIERAHDVGLAAGARPRRAPCAHTSVLLERSPLRPRRWRSACGPAAARRAPTRRGRRRRSSPRCAGSAWPSSPARRARRSPAPFARSAARCSTPKRCCSSITTTPSDRNSTPSWISAWVPISEVDLARRPARRACAGARPPVVRLVSSSTRSGGRCRRRRTGCRRRCRAR